jgi:hypothetical protein
VQLPHLIGSWLTSLFIVVQLVNGGKMNDYSNLNRASAVTELYAPGEKQSTFLQVVLLLFLIGSNYLSPAIIFALAVVTCTFIFFDPLVRLHPGFCPSVKFFGIILFIGLLGSTDKVLYDVAKDCYYFVNVITILSLGYLFSFRITRLESLCRLFVIASVVTSIVHITNFIINPSLILEPVALIREQTTGSFVAVIGVGILLGANRFGLTILKSKFLVLACALISILSIILSFSRTHLLALIMMLFVMSSVITVPKINRLVMISCLLFPLLYGYFLAMPETKSSANSVTSFSDKLRNSITETKMDDYKNDADINTNWRGYESFKAVKTYMDGNLFEYVTGRGFGTNVNLDIVIKLGDDEFSSIPILHNGYLYLLVKSGVLGIILYLGFVTRLFALANRLSFTSDRAFQFTGALVSASAIIIMFTTFIISGVFNKKDLFHFIVMVGMIHGYFKNRHRLDTGVSI